MAGMLVHSLTILLIVETFLQGTEGLTGPIPGGKRAKMVSVFKDFERSFRKEKKPRAKSFRRAWSNYRIPRNRKTQL